MCVIGFGAKYAHNTAGFSPYHVQCRCWPECPRLCPARSENPRMEEMQPVSVWVTMAWHFWQLRGHTPCPQMALPLPPMNQNLLATRCHSKFSIFNFPRIRPLSFYFLQIFLPLLKPVKLRPLPSLPASHHPALWKPSPVSFALQGWWGRGELCHPGKTSVVSPSFDPISTNSPVTFHNNLARWSAFVATWIQKTPRPTYIDTNNTLLANCNN